jgi:hypothetical protein
MNNDKRNKRRKKRGTRKVQPMATTIEELLPQDTVASLRRLSPHGSRKRKNRA